jgi:hypothetical protein
VNAYHRAKLINGMSNTFAGKYFVHFFAQVNAFCVKRFVGFGAIV